MMTLAELLEAQALIEADCTFEPAIILDGIEGERCEHCGAEKMSAGERSRTEVFYEIAGIDTFIMDGEVEIIVEDEEPL